MHGFSLRARLVTFYMTIGYELDQHIHTSYYSIVFISILEVDREW